MNSPLLRFLCFKNNYLNFRTYISLIFVLFYLTPTVYAQNTKSVKWDRFDQSENIKPAQLIESLKEKGLILNDKELKPIKSKTGKNGMNHYSYQQQKDGIPIENAFLIYHSRRNNIVYASNNLIESTSLPTATPKLTKSAAIEKALAKIGAKKYSWENQKFDQLLKNNKKDSNYSSYPNPELCYVNAGFSEKVADYVLAYKMEIYSLEPHGKISIYIDAQDGKFIKELELIHENCNSGDPIHENCDDGTPTTSSVNTLYNGPQSITSYLFENNYELINCEDEIQTFIMANGSTIQSNSPIGSSSNEDFSDFDLDAQQAALSVHWATEHTYDFFLSEGINGNDVFDGPVSSYVNFGGTFDERNNAFYNGSFLTYGAGPIGSETGTFTGPVATTDVVAHEFGHAATKFQSLFGDIEYQGESGAINESFADIFSVLVENYILENVGSDPTINPWIIGEAVTIDGLRSMSSPKNLRQPDTYGGDWWINPANLAKDKGGVHINSGVMNYWFFLLSEGGIGQNDVNFDYNIEGIGLSDAFSILLESYNFLPSQSPSFVELRGATILAGESFALSQSLPECQYTQVIIDAWDAVNVGIGESFGNCVFFAQIEEPITQFCEGSSGEFYSTNDNPAFTEKWYLNDVEVSNPVSFPDLGEHTLRLKLTNTNSDETAFDEINVFVVTCDPIVDEKGTVYFGNGHGFNFSSGKAELVEYDHHSNESSVCQADENGNIIFYIAEDASQTIDLFDNNHNSLTNGAGFPSLIPSLNPGMTSAQFGASIPSANGSFYNVFFNHIEGGSEGRNALYRLIVEVNSENVVISYNLLPVLPPDEIVSLTEISGAMVVYENTVVVPHACSEDLFWVIVGASGAGSLSVQDQTIIFLFDYSDGGEGVLEYHSSESSILLFEGSKMYFTPSGDLALYGDRTVEFDREEGEFGPLLQGLDVLNFSLHAYTFSPNGRYLYAIDENTDLVQYDINAGNIASSKEVLVSNYNNPYNFGLTFNSLRGPDDRIYFNYITGDPDGNTIGGNPINRIGVINYPNVSASTQDVGVNLNVFSFNDAMRIWNGFPTYLQTAIPPSNEVYFNSNQTGCLTVEVSAGPCSNIPEEYRWDFGDGNPEVVSTNNVQTYTYDESGTYEITLMMSSETATEEVTLTGFRDEENLEITGPSSFCDEGFGYFSAPRSVNYLWSVNGDFTNISDVNQQSFYVTWGSDEPYEISVELEDENGCTTTLTKNVVKDLSCVPCEIPIPIITSVQNISQGLPWTNYPDLTYEGCDGDDVLLRISPATNPSDYDYQWNRGTQVNSDPSTIQLEGPGDYEVRIINPGVCFEKIDFLYTEVCCGDEVVSECWAINENTGEVLNGGENCTVGGCEGEDIQLWAKTNDYTIFDFSWEGGTEVPDRPDRIRPDGSGTYNVTITRKDSPSCMGFNSITYEETCCNGEVVSECWAINENTGEVLNGGENCEIGGCEGEDIQLWAKTDDYTAYTFNWDGGTEIPGRPDRIRPDGSNTYNVTITSNNNISCIGFNEITYEETCCGGEIVNECWAKSLSTGGEWVKIEDCEMEGCEGEDVQLWFKTDDHTGFNFLWSGSVTFPIPGRRDIIRTNGTNTYSVAIFSNSTNCMAFNSIDYVETCCNDEVASEFWSRNVSKGEDWMEVENYSFEACEGEDIELWAKTNDYTAYTFNWEGGTEIPGRPDRIKHDGSDTYNVTITSNSTDCTGVKSITYTNEENCCEEGIMSECWAANFTQGISKFVIDDCIYEGCKDDNVRLGVQMELPLSYYTFNWEGGGTEDPDRPDRITPNGPGIYQVTITSIVGCVSIRTIDYRETCCDEGVVITCCEEEITSECWSRNVSGGGSWEEGCNVEACIGDVVRLQVRTNDYNLYYFNWDGGTETSRPDIRLADGSEEYHVTIMSKSDGSCVGFKTINYAEDCCGAEGIASECWSRNVSGGGSWEEGCNVEACIGDVVRLQVRTNDYNLYYFNWEGGIETSRPDIRLADGSEEYNVTITSKSDGSCIGFKTINYENGPSPIGCSYRNNTKNIDWTTTTDCEYIACEGDDVNLTILLDETPTDEWVWAWSEGGTVDQNDQTIFTPDGPGTYTVTITDENNCSTEGYFYYEEEYCCTEDDLLPLECEYKLFSTGFLDAPFCVYSGCEGEQISIRITTPYQPSNNWTWEWSGGTPTGSLYDNIRSVTEPGPYTVTVTDENGCATEKTFTYVQEESIQLNCSYNNLTQNSGWVDECSHLMCTGDEVEISIAPDGGGEGFSGTWEWSNGATGTGSPNTILVSQPGIYTLTLTSNLGCTSVQSFSLTEEACCNDPEPFALTCRARNLTQGGPFQASSDCSYIICEGDELQLYITPDDDCIGCSYEWSPGTTPGNIPLIVNVTESGNYSVVVTNADGCTSDATFMITEEFCCEEIALTCRYNNLSDEIGWITSENCSYLTSCIGDDVRIAFITQTELSPSWTWDWNVEEGIDPVFPNIVTPDGSGTYTVTVTDDNQCTTVGTFEYLEEYCCIDGMTLSCSYNNLSDPDTEWVAGCNYLSCDSDEVIIQITSPYEPNPDWTWNWSAGSSGELPDNQILATGADQYRVTITDEFGCTATGMFDLEVEECCDTEELVNADYQLGFELRPNEGGFPYQECAVTLVDLNYLFDFCEDLVCCPSGIEGIAGTLIIYSNDEPVATLNLAPSSDRMLCISDQLEFTTADLSMCFPSSDKAEVGDVITATYNITEIISECELNITSLNVSAVPYLVTLEDVLSCCDDPAAILECSYNDLTEVSGWVDAEDCTYTACGGNQVQIEISTAQTPDPNWVWQWDGGGTPTDFPNRIIANGAGTYTVTLTDSQGSTVSKSFVLEETCCDVEPFALTCRARNLTQGGPFVISSNCSYTACEGDEVQLYILADDGCAGCTYDWSSGTTPGNIPLIVTVTSLGQYSVIVTNTDGCTSTATFELTEDCGVLMSAPVDQEISKVDMENGNLYGFDSNDETISIDEKTMSGDNDLKYEKEIAKKNESLSKGLLDKDAKELVYPNPFTDEFNLSFLAETSDKYTLILYDINGKIVKSMLGEVNKGRNILVIDDLDNIAVGAYFYRLTMGDQQIIGKIIKQR